MELAQGTLTVEPRSVDPERLAQRRLDTSPYTALKGIKCHFARGTMSLSGKVPSFHVKQLAQEAIKSIPGVTRITNQLTVERCRMRGRTY